MADLLFNPGCLPHPVIMDEGYHATMSRPEDQVMVARQISPEGRRVWSLSDREAPVETVQAILDAYKRTFGGAKPMTFVSPEDGQVRTRFRTAPLWSMNTRRSVGYRFELEEVLADGGG